ncbi:hypothetical protein [Marivirga lumbricoides]|uniref:hypothetical protein n=1 Tax=Marivirga lumbricoides TaxID=1046115 RepID=UPI0016670E79
MEIFQYISLFFITTLFNVVFLQQYFSSTVQVLFPFNQLIKADLPTVNRSSRISEEESKEAREDNQLDRDSFLESSVEFIEKHFFQFLYYSPMFFVSGVAYFKYTSLILTPLSPPPDLG